MNFVRHFIAFFLTMVGVIALVIGSIDLFYHLIGPGYAWFIVLAAVWIAITAGIYAWLVTHDWFRDK